MVTKKYTVCFHQERYGYVNVEAESKKAAEDIARDLLREDKVNWKNTKTHKTITEHKEE